MSVNFTILLDSNVPAMVRMLLLSLLTTGEALGGSALAWIIDPLPPELKSTLSSLLLSHRCTCRAVIYDTGALSSPLLFTKTLGTGIPAYDSS
eukprot:1590577-Ditylum_brightwellii.AAC.2